MFSVIIPVLNQLDLTKQLFGCISKNSILPSEIILIDNASEEDFSDFPKKYENLNIKYIKNEKNIGVNPSWNLGISLSKGKYVSILNSDIIISTSFFKKTIQALQISNDFGIIIPNTTKDRNSNLENDQLPIIRDVEKREGWAFTIRKEILDKIKPIPLELNLFFGDDYFFECSKLLGYRNIKVMNNLIYHYKNATINNEVSKTFRNIMKKEREEWEEIKKQLTSGL